ncbi:MAG: hypothetical protein ACRC28_17420 [Clostridium sp.]|uniref:hypothetical protein n=1 Tax=Clostridium sp. TaxID=1506 RepID=UPI003F32F719
MEIREYHEIKRYMFYEAVNNKFHLNKGVNSAKVDIEICTSIKSRISGRVVFKDNIPAENMLVKLTYFFNGKEYTYQKVTNSDGVYEFFISEYVPNNFKIYVYKNNISS